MANPKTIFAFFAVSYFVIFVVAFSSDASAQATTPEPRVTGTLSNVTRVESWSFFQPPPTATSNPDYTFVGDRSELGVRVEGARFDLAGAFNYVRLENLPTNAIGPGGLGTGAFYYYSSGVPYSYQLYLSELTLRAKTRGNRVSLTIGRAHYASGGEADSGSPALDDLTRDRLHSRLVGDFESSLYQRRFDGVRVDVDRPQWHFTSAAFVPAQGGFEESANLSMPKVQVASAAWTRRGGSTDAPRVWQAFSYLYRDRRPVTVRPDNCGVFFANAADVTVAALGGSHASITPTRAGRLDAVVWAAGEFGDWYGIPHRAASAALEAGHHWTRASMRPWLRAGYLYASGDGDPMDGHHGTFFQMLPSSRQYALSSTYAQMNLRDAFVQALFEPGRAKARVDLHRLDLASGEDLWYQGSGATSSTGASFGFSGRYPRGARALGTIVEGTLDVPIKKHWSINGYLGTLWGGGAVTASFADNRLTSAYIENVIRF